MKNLFLIFLFAGLTHASLAQNMERKIIIENGYFYYTSIDEEFQIATLHTGKISAALKKAKHLAIPAGRNYNSPINPFSWDISDSILYAINFLNHPLNDRNEALKRFSLSSLKEWDSSITVTDMLLKSVDQNTFALNNPYQFVINRSNTLDNFYFDGVALNDSSYYMAIANKGELSIWNYNGREWKHGEVQPLPVDHYFNLFISGKTLYMLLGSGLIYKASMDAVSRVPGKESGTNLSEGYMIINKDTHITQFIKSTHLDLNIPLNELIEKKAINLF